VVEAVGERDAEKCGDAEPDHLDLDDQVFARAESYEQIEDARLDDESGHCRQSDSAEIGHGSEASAPSQTKG
jgi:hypothetical protein